MTDRLRRLLKGSAGPATPRFSFDDWSEVGDAGVLVVCHPEWRGVRTAAYSFRAPVAEVADAAGVAEVLVEQLDAAGAGTLVVHGFPPGSDRLLTAAAQRGVATRVVLHSSMTQHGAEMGEAAVADDVLALAAAGAVGRVGFVKEGLAEAFTALGHPAWFVPNRAPVLPSFQPLALGEGRLNVGVFAEPFWRKNVVTQLGAVAQLTEATAHVLSLPDVQYLSGLDVVEHGTLPWPEFIRLQGSVDLNLYVTLSECLPMTPMESYGAGVPCLLSPTSAVFADDPWLWDISTVVELDNPRAIAAAAERLLAEQDDAVTAAQEWITRWDEAAAVSWERFLG
jgi:hypothetical protein